MGQLQVASRRLLLGLVAALVLGGCGHGTAWVQTLASAPATGLAGTGDRVAFVGQDGVLYGLDATGAPKWKLSGMKPLTPVVAGSIFCTVSTRSQLVGVDSLDGKVRWSLTLPGAVAPAAAGDDYIVGQGTNRLVVLKAKDGLLVKQITLGGAQPSGSGPAATVGFAAAAGQVGPPEDPADEAKAVVHGYLVPSLEEVWAHEVYSGSTLTANQEMVVFVQTRRHARGSSSAAQAWTRTTGRPLWTWEPDSRTSALAERPVLDGQKAWFTWSTGLDPFVSTVRGWRLALTPNPVGAVLVTAPARGPGELLIGNENLLVAVDDATGKKRWSVELEGKVAGPPLVFHDLAYVATVKKKLYAVKL